MKTCRDCETEVDALYVCSECGAEICINCIAPSMDDLECFSCWQMSGV